MKNFKWQWLKARHWYDIAEEASAQIENAFLDKKASVKVWNCNIRKEYDLKAMVLIPGMHKIRRVAAKQSKPLSSENSTNMLVRKRSSCASLSALEVQSFAVGSSYTSKEKRKDLHSQQMNWRSGSKTTLLATSNSAPEILLQKSVTPTQRRSLLHEHPSAIDRSVDAPSNARVGDTTLPSSASTSASNPKSETRDKGHRINEVAEALQALVHPIFQDMLEPRFEFDGSKVWGDGSQTAQHRSQSLGTHARGARPHTAPASCGQGPQHLGGMCEGNDLAYKISSLAREYAELLTQHSATLPIHGSAEEAMAALSLGFYMSGMSAAKIKVDNKSVGFASRPASAPARFGARLHTSPRCAANGVLPSSHATRVTFKVGQDCKLSRETALAIKNAWEDWHVAARSLPPADDLNSLSAQDDSYEWIRTSNAESDCLVRLRGACATLRRSFQLCEMATSKMQIALLRNCRRRMIGSSAVKSTTPISLSRDSALDAAVLRSQAGNRVAVVIFSSSYRVGGDFLSGRRHGPEEHACMRSNLFLSLLEASREAQRMQLCDTRGHSIHIPEDGIVLSKDVQVFRGGYAQGYPPLADPIYVAAVLSMSLPNMKSKYAINVHLHGHPNVGASKSTRHAMLVKKFGMVIQGACDAQASILVMSDEGHEATANDPAVLGTAFGLALTECPLPKLPRVILTGSSIFVTSVRDQLGSKLVSVQ